GRVGGGMVAVADQGGAHTRDEGSTSLRGWVAVDLEGGGEVSEGGEEAGTEGGKGGGGAGGAVGEGGGRGGAEAGDGGGRGGAGARRAPRAAAGEERTQGGPGPDHQGADAGGAAELVGGQGEQVDAVGGHVDPGQPGGLDGVAEQDRPGAAGQLGRGRDRLAGADLVVGRHHRDKGRPPRPDQRGPPAQVDPAPA